MKRLLSAVFFLLSWGAHASYLESCELEVRPLTNGVDRSLPRLFELNTSIEGRVSKVLVAEVLKAKDKGSHSANACAEKLNTILALQLNEDMETRVAELAKEGANLKLDYFYANWLAPTGPGQTTSYKLLD